ncbi:MAG: hypothetical protein WBF53_05395 [Litorimonas sp.]
MPTRLFGLSFFTSRGGPRSDWTLDTEMGPVPDVEIEGPSASDFFDFQYPPESAFSKQEISAPERESLTRD